VSAHGLAKETGETIVYDLQRRHAPAYDAILIGQIVTGNAGIVIALVRLCFDLASAHALQQGIDFFLSQYFGHISFPPGWFFSSPESLTAQKGSDAKAWNAAIGTYRTTLAYSLQSSDKSSSDKSSSDKSSSDKSSSDKSSSDKAGSDKAN
jgi:hypothetical protein